MFTSLMCVYIKTGCKYCPPGRNKRYQIFLEVCTVTPPLEVVMQLSLS